jgi:PH (Pleckstrin Homology) domain-containing protein
VAERQTFRSPFAVLIWWVWVLFALGNLIDLAVQGRDHLSVVAAFILVLVTGVMYTTAQRPRIIADEDGLTVANPLRDHRIGWAAVAGFDSTGLLRVRCEWPPDRARAQSESLDAAEGSPQNVARRAIYSWAVHTSRRRQVTAQMRVERPRLRSRSVASTGGSYGVPQDRAPSAPPPAIARGRSLRSRGPCRR